MEYLSNYRYSSAFEVISCRVALLEYHWILTRIKTQKKNLQTNIEPS